MFQSLLSSDERPCCGPRAPLVRGLRQPIRPTPGTRASIDPDLRFAPSSASRSGSIAQTPRGRQANSEHKLERSAAWRARRATCDGPTALAEAMWRSFRVAHAQRLHAEDRSGVRARCAIAHEREPAPGRPTLQGLISSRASAITDRDRRLAGKRCRRRAAGARAPRIRCSERAPAQLARLDRPSVPYAGPHATARNRGLQVRVVAHTKRKGSKCEVDRARIDTDRTTRAKPRFPHV